MARRWIDRAPLVIAGLAGGTFLVESWQLGPQLDDAYISYRYARNLAEGYGLVYNPGEYVEGFTNILWTLLVALGVRLGLEAPAVGHFLGLLSGLGALFATWVYASTGLPRSQLWVGALAPWLLLSATPFPVWATSGMETLLFTAAATAALAAQARGRIGAASVWLAVATLTRPEGALLALVVFGVHFATAGIRSPATRGTRSPATRGIRSPATRGIRSPATRGIRSPATRGIRSPRALVPVLAWLAVPVLLTAFRLAYYGSPLPNTFYAKVGGIPIESGLAYLARFLADGSLVLIPAAAVVVGRKRWWAGIAWVLALSAYVVAIGGDAFGQWRFLLPCLPVLAALSLRGALRAFTLSPWAGAALGLTVPGAALWMVLGGAAQDEFPGSAARWDMLARVDQGNRNFEEVGRRRAELLRAETPAPRLVASGAIGSFGYYSRLPILDYFGIVDPEVARSPASEALPGERRLPGHHRSNAEYVFSRRPDTLLVPDKSRGLRFQRAGGILDLWAHPAFDAFYVWDEELGATAGWKSERRATDRTWC